MLQLSVSYVQVNMQHFDIIINHIQRNQTLHVCTVTSTSLVATSYCQSSILFKYESSSVYLTHEFKPASFPSGQYDTNSNSKVLTFGIQAQCGRED